MGKIKKTNADKTQQGSNRWVGPMQSSVFFCLFVCFSFFFPFCPSIGHQKNEKGSGRYRKRRERKREKRERGEGEGKNL